MLERVGLAQRVTHGRASCPAASASAWRWRARWSRSRPACWPTSRPATSTATPRNSIFDLMLELSRTLGTAFVIVTHDMELARRCDRVLRLSDNGLEPWTRTR